MKSHAIANKEFNYDSPPIEFYSAPNQAGSSLVHKHGMILYESTRTFRESRYVSFPVNEII
jgi:hypothetical protein